MRRYQESKDGGLTSAVLRFAAWDMFFIRYAARQRWRTHLVTEGTKELVRCISQWKSGLLRCGSQRWNIEQPIRVGDSN